ncbi:unknown [Firmicutes bacterium CAG:137]|nr:unknown [Firmicutes bacterium CAG:137]
MTELLLQKAYGILQPVAPQGIGANQLGKVPAVVGRRHFLRLHFHEANGNVPFGQLPGRLAACQARANHLYLCHHWASPDFFFVLAAVVFLAAVFLAVPFLGASSGVSSWAGPSAWAAGSSVCSPSFAFFR